MTDEQTERLLLTLERIARALETTTPPPYTGGYGSVNGWQCARCFTWVIGGVNHVCLSGSGIGSTTAPASAPSIRVDPGRCAYTTAAHMQCTLEANHASGHNIGI